MYMELLRHPVLGGPYAKYPTIQDFCWGAPTFGNHRGPRLERLMASGVGWGLLGLETGAGGAGVGWG